MSADEFAKGDRVLSETLGFGVVLAEPNGFNVPVVFDDDIAPVRNIPWWMLSKESDDALSM